jgi:hypothetical protein
MRLADVQAYVAAQIAAVPALAAFGSAVQYDPLNTRDPDNPADTTKGLDDFIDRRLEAAGVVILIDPPYCESGATNRAGASLLNLVVFVKIAESITKAHTPKGEALVSAVIGAVTAPHPSLAGEDTASCAGFDAWEDENGYILRVIDFRIRGVEP